MVDVFVGVFLLCEAMEDLRTQKLGVAKLMFFGVIALFMELCLVHGNFMEVLMGAVLGVASLAVAWVTKEAIGYGDGVVMLIVGICCGLFRTLQTFILAIIVMIFVSMAMMLKKGVRLDLKIPFVPCLFIGYLGGLLL